MQAHTNTNEFATKLAYWAPALLISAAWIILFAPVYFELSLSDWRREENAHIPFIMAIIFAIGWTHIRLGEFRTPTGFEVVIGGIAIALGGGALCFGRFGEIALLTSISQFIIAGGMVLALLSMDGVRRLWFPFVLSIYLIIWPGWAIAAVTGPLKIAISGIVAEGLYAFGLPVASSGAVISAGSYELLVADACAGVNALFALTSVGAIYLYIVRRPQRAVNAVVLLSLVPIAILSNMLRVAMLVLITLFLGYDAGQSFLHEAAGLFTFAVALGMVFLVDAAAVFILGRRS